MRNPGKNLLRTGLVAGLTLGAVVGVANAQTRYHIMLFDTTGSMSLNVTSPCCTDRDELARFIATSFDLAGGITDPADGVPNTTNDFVAVAAFDTLRGYRQILGFRQQGIAANRNDVIDAINDDLEAPGGATNLADAMCGATSVLNAIAGPGDEKYLWIYTDGDENASDGGWDSFSVCGPCAPDDITNWPNDCAPPGVGGCPGPFVGCSDIQSCVFCELSDTNSVFLPRYFGLEIVAANGNGDDADGGEEGWWVEEAFGDTRLRGAGLNPDLAFLSRLARASGGQTVTYTDEAAVGCIGDIDGDGATGLGDLGIVFAAWNSTPNLPNWNPAADLNGDQAVNLGDLGILFGDWNCGAN